MRNSDTLNRDAKMKRTLKEKIVEAERQLHESSKIWLSRERKILLDQQERSLEPDGYGSLIAEIDRKLESPQGEGLRDLLVYVLKQKEQWSWLKISNQVYRDVKSKEARKSEVRRAWHRADKWLETAHPDKELTDVLNRAGLF
jgi:hypothetical protein